MKILKTTPPIVSLAHFQKENNDPISSKQIHENLKPFFENKHIILAAAHDLECLFDLIISHYFFGKEKENYKRKKSFNDLILSSEWCSFSSKRQLLLHIVNEYEIFKGKEKSKFEKLISNVMTYRNAFTHGTVHTDGYTFKLTYFKGIPQEKIIDDNYISDIESDINECARMTKYIIWPVDEFKKQNEENK